LLTALDVSKLAPTFIKISLSKLNLSIKKVRNAKATPILHFFTLTMFLTYAIGLGEGATKIIVTGCLFLLAILLTLLTTATLY